MLAAQGSLLTNKYAEGYPGKRYYGGCEFVDIAEQLAIDRAKQLFGAGVRQRAAALRRAGEPGGVLRRARSPGDTILGMSLPHGGHLTHGSPVNLSGKWFEVIPYGLDPKTELIDYDAGRGARARAQAEADHRRRVGLFARDRLEALPRDRRRGRRHADGRHGALRGPRRRGAATRRRSASRDFVTTTTHKTLRGPRGGMILCRRAEARRRSTRPCSPACRAAR